MENTEETRPKHGDIKTERKFAIFPTRIGNQTIWLKEYIQHYKYFGLSMYMVGFAPSPGWEETTRELIESR